MSDDDLGKVFDDLFGKDDRTDEQRAADSLIQDRKRNARSYDEFYEERKRRIDYMAMDDRVQGIAVNVIWRFLCVLTVIIAFYFAGYKYGWLGVIGVGLLLVPVVWFYDRENQKQTSFKIDEIDQLAEDTIAHERIVSFASSNKPWLPSGNESPLFENPYWYDVNQRVTQYSRQKHKLRLADNAAARAASLPYRKKALSALRENDGEAELPYWARIDSKELPN